ncbi:MAG TPA: hypothetical protein VLN48_04370 [Bryobacteraceae bacterium]|nr:hypothetical protein [Bryobacteraceae bacterium]
MGYPLVVESNAAGPLRLAAESWGTRPRLFDAPPLRLTIHVQKGGLPASEPAYQACAGGFSLLCDPLTRAEFSIRDHAACLHSSGAVLDRPEWFRHQLLECLVLTALDTVYFVGLHAACVVPPGHGKPGVLLCGVSGSGKSTLAYACARSGWTFVSDDSHLAPGADNIVTGSSHCIRLREPARALFPEIRTRSSVLAPNGKQCIEVEPAGAVAVADFASARQCIFLSRRAGRAALRRYPEEDAVEYFLRYNTRYDRSSAERRLREFVRGGTWLLEYERLEDAIELLGRLP